MGYVANWALVVATTNEGRQMYAYKNQPISVAVTAEEIGRLLEEGAIVAAPKVEPAPVVEAPSPEGLDGLDLPGLRAFAAERGIDLGGATKKADLLAAITAAL